MKTRIVGLALTLLMGFAAPVGHADEHAKADTTAVPEIIVTYKRDSASEPSPSIEENEAKAMVKGDVLASLTYRLKSAASES